MPTSVNTKPSHAPILFLAEIKAAVQSFDRGDANVFDALDSILIAVEAYRATTKPKRKAA